MRVKFLCEDDFAYDSTLGEIEEYPQDKDRVTLVSADVLERVIIADFEGPLVSMTLLDVTINFAGKVFSLMESGEWMEL